MNMKKLLRILFIPLVFLFILSSCTMEKRLYRPGYYVSHKKSATVPEKQEHIVAKDIIPATEKKDNPAVKTGKPETIPVSTIRESKPAKENTVETFFAFSKKKQKEAGSSPTHNSVHKITTANAKPKSGSSIRQKNHAATHSSSGSGNRAVRGLIMILVALLLIGLAAIFAVLIGGTGGLLFGWLFGLAAFILIIVGLVMIILGIAGA
jgi:hypothetical protein